MHITGSPPDWSWSTSYDVTKHWPELSSLPSANTNENITFQAIKSLTGTSPLSCFLSTVQRLSVGRYRWFCEETKHLHCHPTPLHSNILNNSRMVWTTEHSYVHSLWQWSAFCVFCQYFMTPQRKSQLEWSVARGSYSYVQLLTAFVLVLCHLLSGRLSALPFFCSSNGYTMSSILTFKPLV